VIQFCDLEPNIERICSTVKESGFEFTDFKITFSISIMAYLNKIKVISTVEDALAKKFTKSSKDMSKVRLLPLMLI
jgi:hypothetical protein